VLAAIALALLVFAGAFAVTRFQSPMAVRASAEPPAVVPEAPSATIDTAPLSKRERAEGADDVAGSPDCSEGSASDVADSGVPAAQGAIRLRGSIVLPSADPDECAYVALVDRNGKQEDRNTGKGNVREFAFDGLAAGEYFLAASALGHRSERRTIVLRQEETDRKEDFTLQPLWLLGVRVVTPDGEDLSERLRKDGIAMAWATVFATVDPPGATLPKSLWMDRQDMSIAPIHFGTAVGGKPSRSLEISSDPPFHVSAAMREIVLATRRVDAHVSEIELVVDPEVVKRSLASLTFVVVDDATGAPAKQSSIMLRTAQTGEAPIHPDDHGRVSFEGRVPGLYEIQITMPQRALTTIPADLVPGQTTDLGIVRLGQGVLIRGRCVDANGVAQDALPSVYASDDDSGSQRKPALCFYGSESDPEHGGFAISFLPAGRYVIAPDGGHVSPEDWKSGKRLAFVPAIVDTRNGPVEDLVVLVSQPVPLVLHPTSEAVDGVRYELRTAGGLHVASGRFWGAKPERVPMAPSRYRLLLSRGNETIREVPFTLGTETLEMQVDP
jgi:hypothetical protein